MEVYYDVDEVIDSLENETDIQLKLLLADLYMGIEEYEDAASIYNNIPVYDRETELMKELRLIQIHILKNGKTWFDIGTEGYDFEDDLMSIAFEDTTIASFQAMAILSLINDTLYPLPFQDKEGEPSAKMSGVSINESLIEKEFESYEWQYALYPTLIRGELHGMISLPDKEFGFLEIFNIQGMRTGTFKIQEGINQIPLSNSLPQSGIYIYKVFIDNEIKRTAKLVKIQ